MSERKGIILAGGTGTRLFPCTEVVSKQLLPIYDKPMIFYPLSILMLSGIKEVLIICTSDYVASFKQLFGDGADLGMDLEYAVQSSPDGLAQAYLIAEQFLGGRPSALVLGDNIHYGHGLSSLLLEASSSDSGTIFCKYVNNPKRFGVIALDENGQVESIVEKPESPPTNFAVTGLYFLDGDAPARAKDVKKSDRGELEITSLLQMYADDGQLSAVTMGRGYSWFDTGTHESMLEASSFVKTIQNNQGQMIGCIHEIAYKDGLISYETLKVASTRYAKSSYGQYLKSLL